MYSKDELVGLYGFLKSTNEGNLKKMLVNGKFTDVHLRVLLKIVRTANENEFLEHLEKSTLPRIKLAGPELALKETIWASSLDACASVGLLSRSKAA